MTGKLTHTTGSEKESIKKKKASKSYAEWLKSHGIASQSIYENSLKDAETEYKMAKAEYGARAEALAKSGLSGSGYSDYLSAKAYEAMQKNKFNAKNAFQENERQNVAGYETYLANIKSEQNKLYKSTGDDIIKNQITKYDEAYRFAVESGLSSEKAEKLAKTATKIVNDEIKKAISKLIIENKLSDKEASAYAIFHGLSKEDADELAKFAKSYNYINFGNDESDSYLDFIEEQTKGTKR
jgi:Mn-dependent DtxR family transcriptional regulator